MQQVGKVAPVKPVLHDDVHKLSASFEASSPSAAHSCCLQLHGSLEPFEQVFQAKAAGHLGVLQLGSFRLTAQQIHLLRPASAVRFALKQTSAGTRLQMPFLRHAMPHEAALGHAGTPPCNFRRASVMASAAAPSVASTGVSWAHDWPSYVGSPYPLKISQIHACHSPLPSLLHMKRPSTHNLYMAMSILVPWRTYSALSSALIRAVSWLG